MTSYIREIMHEIILNQIQFVNMIPNNWQSSNKARKLLAYFILLNYMAIDDLELAKISWTDFHYIKTRPTFTFHVKIRTSVSKKINE